MGKIKYFYKENQTGTEAQIPYIDEKLNKIIEILKQIERKLNDNRR